MSGSTKIEWSEATWNPIVGCEHVSPGCDNCYAAREASGRLSKTPAYAGLAVGGKFTGEVRLLPERLDQPFRWRRPRRIFVNSMSDLFHDSIPDEYIADVWHVMAQTPQHSYQILTKRHGRMRSWVNQWCSHPKWSTPLLNVWLGVSVEDQHWADIRIPALLDTPAAVRWISAEPLLGLVDLTRLRPTRVGGPLYSDALRPVLDRDTGQVLEPALGWVVAGGESGPAARPMHPDWARALRDQCQAAGVPFLFKQWGEWQYGSSIGKETHVVLADGRHYPGSAYWETGQARRDDYDRSIVTATMMSRVGKKAAGRELDGRTWDEYPKVVPG